MGAHAQQESFFPSTISLTLRYLRPFERGMEEGAISAALDMEDTGKSVGFRCGFTQSRENDKFAQGFELGKKYVDGWRAGMDLLRLAIHKGDVTPVDFKEAICPDSLNFYWEEI